MLKEISCVFFKEQTITFKQGLNVVLGDNLCTNSIGKSSLLQVIDYVFGGSSFLDFDNGAIKMFGHHEYKFKLEFDGVGYFFVRDTDNPDIVSCCDEKYNVKSKIGIDEYNKFLVDQHKLSSTMASFRQVVGLFSRVWGKHNLDVNRPLHLFSSEKMSDSVNRLIKIFNKYKELALHEQELLGQQNEIKSLRSAFKFKFIPQINKRQYKINVERIKEIHFNLDEIKKKLVRNTCDLNDILTGDLFDLKITKDKILNYKLDVLNKLERIEDGINGTTFKKSNEIVRLKGYFPDINEERLFEVEKFHSDISEIMFDNLRAAKEDLFEELVSLELELDSINNEINSKISSVPNVSPIIDNVFDISTSLEKLKAENLYYEKYTTAESDLKEKRQYLDEMKRSILDNIEDVVNSMIKKFTAIVYGEARKTPTLKLEPTRYEFSVVEDKGTGKYYANLIIFDLSIFCLTSLPFLIHDSVLFKNIENVAFGNIVKIYNDIKKQSFIAIDGIDRYAPAAYDVLMSNCVIHLSKDKLLYTADWRK